MKTASFEIHVEPARAVGRMACIQVGNEKLYGNVLDVIAGTDTPKRVRIQRGNPGLCGNVVSLGAYEFLWWADEEED